MQHSSWHALIKGQLPEGYFGEKINQFMNRSVLGTVYPPKRKGFQALLTTPLEEVKVVILGQDPYLGPGQAQGLSFSVPDALFQRHRPCKILEKIGRYWSKSIHDLTAGLGKILLLNACSWAGQWSCWTNMEPLDAVIRVVNNRIDQ